ncbi:COG4223 family protein [Bradyrhizobium canariense]|uniref:COG4223 family protein n=1 Tax=Bradyrhizobium canariense TaxID=255045 RepID=UPI003D9B5129
MGRVKRAPPTIDLQATEVTQEPQNMAGDAAPEPRPEAESQDKLRDEVQDQPRDEPLDKPENSARQKPPAAISPWVIAPFSGAVAAALVIGVGWVLGWPAIQPATTAAPQVSAAAVDDLAARVASMESRVNKPAASDPAASARVAALEKSVASLRDEVTAVQAQSDKLATAVAGAKPAPGDAAAAVDLSGITERLNQLERATRAESAAVAKESAKPADDTALRRLVVASLLDISVRQGDPFTATLSAAKSLAPDPDALKPLEAFAATGVPTAAGLSRELLTLVPKLAPPAPGNDAPSSSLVDRLQAGASRLVRIERTDGVGNDRGAIVARMTAAALRNDSSEARRELNTLSPADRAAAQPWIDKADARDAALAASRQFAADATAALANPPQ